MTLKHLLFTACLMGALVGASAQAEARSKEWYYNWSPDHWHNQDFQPYVENYRETHMPMGTFRHWQYERQLTSPQIVRSWKRARLMKKFYVDEDRDISILEVDSNFYRLSSNEKRRFLETVNQFYRITYSPQQALFLRDWNTHQEVGVYTQHGLMLF